MKEFLFCEKYRPKSIAECILPKDTKDTLLNFVKKGDFPNLILSGSPGIGKTSVARALTMDLDMEMLFINGSEQRSIDVVRTSLRDFACIKSVDGKRKVIIIDEFENFTPSAQEALKTFIEEFKNVRFIFTCNHINKVIPPIHSRTTTIEFKILPTDYNVVLAEFSKKTFEIMKAENITFDAKVVIQVVKKNFPDFRKTLNDLQKYSASGSIDVGVLNNSVDQNINTLITSLKARDFSTVRQWTADNAHYDIETFFKDVYSVLVSHVKEDDIPELFIIIAQYQYQSAFAMVQEINTTAFLAEVIKRVSFK